jgi:alkylation response protein AidB-like acyl-CoA dehydrogenase
MSGSDRASQVREAVEALKASGLLAATVPARLGGDGLPASVIAEVFRILASGDGSLGQVPQSHMTFSRWLFTGTHPQEERRWADILLGGALIANAQVDREPTVLDGHRLSGRKVFCTGSAYADILAVTARRTAGGATSDGPKESEVSEVAEVVVFLPVETPGVRVLDDWSAMGQEYTASGTVVLEDVHVPDTAVRTMGHVGSEDSEDSAGGVNPSGPTTAPPAYGAFAQLLHTAVDVGVSGAALSSALGIAHTDDPDPLTSHLAGNLVARQFAAEAALEKAGRSVDAAWASPDDPRTGTAASLDVAAAKATTGALTVDLASRVFELTGTRGATGPGSLDLARHWRDLRTHTLHDRHREKLAMLGHAALSGRAPVPGRKL